jgi:hypothetical protein
MKLASVEIAGFRGALPSLPLPLDQKSICIFGENGYGKSTIADGLEFWSTGDIDAFHRSGCQIDAAVHVYADEAAITVRTDGAGPIRRSLKGKKASDLEVVDQVADPSKAAGLPLLRHETVSDFIRKSAGDKKDELLQLVGLDPLMGFREALRKAKSEAKRSNDATSTSLDAERLLLAEKCEEKEVVTFAEELRAKGQLQTPIKSLDDLRVLTVDEPSAKGRPDLLGAVDNLERHLIQASSADHNDWDALVADSDALQRQAIAALLREGQRVMPVWNEDSCPLCLSDYPRDILNSELARRVAELKDVEDRFEAGKRQLEDTSQSWRELERSIVNALRLMSDDDEWPNQTSLESAKNAVHEYVDHLATSLRDRVAAGDRPNLTLASELAQMRAAAADDESPDQTARINLSLLRAQLERVDEAEMKHRGAKQDLETISVVLGIADDKIEAAINDAIREIGDLVAAFYLKISGSIVYSDVKIAYDSKYAGGAEFSVMYDGKKTFKPPQRIMSNGQLNALALAFFLAKTKLSDSHWRTIVLDDVISSFGGVHRRGLLDLLDTEFADWQVLLLTHDKTFSLLAREVMGTGWKHGHISQWTPSGGPVLVNGDPLDRLQARLDEGAGASELGGIGREAFEQTLAIPLEKLGYLIPYRSGGRYTGMDYLIALRRGLKHAKSPLAEAQVLSKLAANNFALNLASHHQPNLSGAETADFVQLAEDLREVRALFKCDKCNEQAWTVKKGSDSHTCRCKQLAA